MRKWQVGEHTDGGASTDEVAHGFHLHQGSFGYSLEVVHDALGCASRARGVHQYGDVFGFSCRFALERRSFGNDRIPGCVVVLGSQGERHAGQTSGNARLLLVKGIELAHEQHAGAAVFQHELDGFCSFGGEDGCGGAASHPDGQLGHDEVGAVFGQDGDTGAGFEVLGLDVGGHAAGLVQGLGPGVVSDGFATERLRHVNTVRLFGFVVVDVIKNEFLRSHTSLRKLSQCQKALSFDLCPSRLD